jgi:hypothetical protein
MPYAGPNYVNQDPDLSPPVKAVDWDKVNRIRTNAGSQAIGFLTAALACDLIKPPHLITVQRIVKQWEDADK